VTPDTFDLSVIALGLNLPTRIKISPDGQFMFISELSGNVILFVKSGDEWNRQDTLFYDLGDLEVTGERGLTALFFGANFDPKSPDSEDRDVFLSYQIQVALGGSGEPVAPASA